LNIFLNDVKEQSMISTLRSYLKLYSSISVSKLAHFLEIDEETLRVNLMCVKHKTQNMVWNGCPLLSGQLSSSFSDIDFYIDKDMIHIATTKVARRFGDYFSRHITKFEEILNNFE